MNVQIFRYMQDKKKKTENFSMIRSSRKSYAHPSETLNEGKRSSYHIWLRMRSMLRFTVDSPFEIILFGFRRGFVQRQGITVLCFLFIPWQLGSALVATNSAELTRSPRYNQKWLEQTKLREETKRSNPNDVDMNDCSKKLTWNMY